MASHQRINTNIIPPIASSSRSPPHSSASPPLVQDTGPKTFNRLASIGQSIRTATRSKKAPAPESDDFATITTKTVKGKGREKIPAEELPKEKDKMNVFGKLGSKVTFRRTRRESLAPSPLPLPQDAATSTEGKERVAGVTSFMTPSLRLASLSSPAIHLSSQALPSPKSQPSVPASSSSGAAALVSPTRERTRRASLQPQPTEISSPIPLTSKRERPPAGPSREFSTRHRSTKSNPPEIPIPTSVPNTPHRNSSRDTQNRPSIEMESPLNTPTPSPTHRGRVVRTSTIRPAAAHPEPSSPRNARPISPLRTRSPPHPRVVSPTNRGLVSSSATHLHASSPSPPPRRPSIDAPRRPSIDSPRRPSVDSPRRVSGETPRRSSRDSPVDYRTESPTPVRPRPTSPNQRAYAQNRHYNISAASLISPYNVEQREQLRKAASMLCKEMVKPPPHMSKSEQASRNWDEVERRLHPLSRLERIWGMSSISSASNLNLSTSGMSSSGLSAAGEERERRVFCEALRDGFVLCQLVNKLRAGNMVRPDPREDGFIKTSNVTKFLAACASYGLQHEDLFHRDDLIEGTSESLARVAHTIIALIQFVDTPAPSRIKWIKPASPKPNASTASSSAGPYMKGSLGRASASTPNLMPLSTPPTPTSPRKRYSPPMGLPTVRSDSSEEGHSATPKTPPMRQLISSGSRVNVNVIDPSDSEVTTGGEEEEQDGMEQERGEVIVVRPVTTPPPLLRPPPKSPLRPQSVRREQERKRNDGGISAWVRSAASPPTSGVSGSPPAPRLGLGPGLSRVNSMAAESTRASVGNASFLDSPIGISSLNEYNYARQSVASSAATDTTVTTQVSSILDNHHGHGGHTGSGSGSGSGGNKFGTVRTMTTDLTSEVPSMTRTEGAAIADELVRKESLVPPVPPPKGLRERRPSGAHMHGHAIDLTRVAEEPDESGSSGGHRKEKERDRDPKGKGRVEESPTKGVRGAGDRVHAAVHLHKAKWPDDFLDAFQLSMQSSTSSSDQEEPPKLRPASPSYAHAPMSRSVSPPRKVAIVGMMTGRRADGSNESANLAPRRPTHLPRHSMDTTPTSYASGSTSTLASASTGATAGLLPKESILRRDTSPDAVLGSGSRIMLRRTSTNKSPLPSLPQPRAGSSLSMSRNGTSALDSEGDENSNGGAGKGGNGTVPVPFPRRVSDDRAYTPSPSPRAEAFGNRSGNTSTSAASGSASSSGNTNATTNERPRPPRGRFQSEINGSSRVKETPNSYDDLGAKPSRMRFESMVNLGRVDSAMASASDLMVRDSIDGSAVRKMLVVREEGKPPTHFQLGNCIGKGQFGSVYRALNLNTGQMVAVKRIRLEGLKEDEISTLMDEVDLVKRLSHPGIVKYEGMARDEDTLNIVLEYAENGSLAHTLKAFGKLNEKLVASYVVKILEGLHYLHQSDVVHCDLKAANILTTKNGNVKLSDFGVSLNLRTVRTQNQNDVAGTPNWMAPEIIELRGPQTQSDIWSLGCTVIELMTGRPPYAEISNSMTVMFRIVEDDMPPIPEGCSELLQDFLQQCFHKDYSKRPSAELLCEHPWLKKNWVGLKDLRPQDSIPFLRRVSADLQKSDMVRYFAKMDPDSPNLAEFPRDIAGSPPPVSSSSPVGRRTSNASIRPPQLDTEFKNSPSEHSFVKTTFSKPVICRVCLENVKKSAVLCSKCSLISHSKCAPTAPPTCDLRSQLLLYAQYAEQGNSSSLYSNPLSEQPDFPRSPVAMSDVPYVTINTPRSSVDTPSPQPTNSPPTAFKLKSVFKRSRSNLVHRETAPSSAPASEPDLSNSRTALKDAVGDKAKDPHLDEVSPVARKRQAAVLHKRSKERPRSYTSNSTGLSSLRSAATAAESMNSNGQNGTGRLSQLSNVGNPGTSSSQERDRVKKKSVSVKVPVIPPVSAPDAETNDFAELSTTSSVLPGSLPPDTATRRARAKRDSKQSGNCVVQ
ncbi:hypothetical protein P691DRAFT_809889 [Macrolepiota fuliginosa MF-IS2]|uniref:Pkinase-domain-containing protein n=1 Tax=Macrolepiota fuliginosa MF-IS2 TaxID=1400762 RepID=A0A9P5XP24_9AGAR|nr:hypothetical protein P691DRAFT_809889 [Macrolepiota fuliginosa MF-IS2]